MSPAMHPDDHIVMLDMSAEMRRKRAKLNDRVIPQRVDEIDSVRKLGRREGLTRCVQRVGSPGFSKFDKRQVILQRLTVCSRDGMVLQ
jgi:hypothetical protein